MESKGEFYISASDYAGSGKYKLHGASAVFLRIQHRLTPEIIMELLQLKHTEALYKLVEVNRAYLREWLPWLDQIKTSNDTKQFIEFTMQKVSSGGAPKFAVLYKGIICSVAGFHEINKQHRRGCIGYWLAQNYTGKGIMIRVVAGLLEIGFGELNLHKIEVHCAEGTNNSRAIPERWGFTYEATLRQCEWLYAKYVDHAIYSMLVTEYNIQ